MEYTVKALAELAGVTPRTLRWYHQIGLLPPGRVGENGYRYYGPRQADRLQDILYYRALGVELSQIKAYLDDPAFDRIAALRGHLAALLAEQARLEGLVASLRKTIDAQERSIPMKDEEKFEAFKRRAVEANEAAYGPEIRKKRIPKIFSIHSLSLRPGTRTITSRLSNRKRGKTSLNDKSPAARVASITGGAKNERSAPGAMA